jgi:chromatin-remodeling ATPase INO80
LLINFLKKYFQKKSSHKKHTNTHDNDSTDKNGEPDVGGDHPGSIHTENEQIGEPRPKRSKRLMKSITDKELAAAAGDEEPAENHRAHDYDGTEEVQDGTAA